MSVAVLFSFMTVLALAENQTGTMNTDSKVMKEAGADAPVVGQLQKGAAVQIIDRNGGWMKVQGGGLSGWVKSILVRREAKPGNINDVAAVISGRGATGQVVSTSGTRGLDADTLKSAKFNQQELDKLEAHKVDNKTARQFAQTGSLAPISLAYPQPVESSAREDKK